MTAEEYKKRLDKHDWYYAMSDDPRWFDEGSKEEEELKLLASRNPEFKTEYDNMITKLFRNGKNTTS